MNIPENGNPWIDYRQASPHDYPHYLAEKLDMRITDYDKDHKIIAYQPGVTAEQVNAQPLGFHQSKQFRIHNKQSLPTPALPMAQRLLGIVFTRGSAAAWSEYAHLAGPINRDQNVDVSWKIAGSHLIVVVFKDGSRIGVNRNDQQLFAVADSWRPGDPLEEGSVIEPPVPAPAATPSPAPNSSNETVLPFPVLENISDVEVTVGDQSKTFHTGGVVKDSGLKDNEIPAQLSQPEILFQGTATEFCNGPLVAAKTLVQDLLDNWTPIARVGTARANFTAKLEKLKTLLNMVQLEVESQDRHAEIMAALADLKKLNTHSVTISNPVNPVPAKSFDPARFDIDPMKPVAHNTVERTSDSIRYYARLTTEGHKLPEGAAMYAYPPGHAAITALGVVVNEQSK